MALPTGEDLKTLLRIENDAEDALCDDLIESAKAHAESLIGRPIQAVERTFTGLVGSYDRYQRGVLYLPEYPVSLEVTDAVEITDLDGNVVDDADYVVTNDGLITTVLGKSFAWFPYTVVAKVGLSVASDYATRIEPMLRSLILGIASTFYKQRNPNAVSDSGGGGVSVTYQGGEYTDGLPNHLYSLVRKLRPVRPFT